MSYSQKRPVLKTGAIAGDGIRKGDKKPSGPSIKIDSSNAQSLQAQRESRKKHN